MIEDNLSNDNQIDEPIRTIEVEKTHLITGLFQKIREKIEETNKHKVGITLIIFIMLFSFSLLVRLLCAFYFRKFFYTDYLEIIWNRKVQLIPNDMPFMGFTDFPDYYLEWARAWFEEGWRPYSTWVEGEPWNVLNLYSYPPLFLYSVTLFWRPGMRSVFGALSILLGDALCSGMVFLIIKEVVKGKFSQTVAIVGGLLMALSPINVIYEGVYWFNLQPITLFTLITFYFVIKKKWWQSFVWLAFAFMAKQNALFLTFPLFMFMLGEKLKEKNIKKSILESFGNVGIFLSVCFLFSVPWLFTTRNYIPMLFSLGGNIELSTIIYEPALTQSIRFSWAIYVLGIKGWFSKIVAFGVNSMLFMIISAVAISIVFFIRTYRNKLDNIEFFELITLYNVFVHIFMPRGVYKFYSAYYAPIITITIVTSLAYYIKNWRTTCLWLTIAVLFLLCFGLGHLWIPRDGTPLLLFLVCLIIGVLMGIRTIFKNRITKKKFQTIISNESSI